MNKPCKFDDKVADILKLVKSMRTPEGKLLTLRAFKQSVELERVLRLGLDPAVKFRWTLPNVYPCGDVQAYGFRRTLDSALDTLEDLLRRKNMKKLDRNVELCLVIWDLRRKDAKILNQIVLKSFDHGVTIDMVNQVWER